MDIAPTFPRRILVVFNPTAGRRRSRLLAATLAELRKLGCSVDVVETAVKGDAEAFAANARRDDYDAIAVAGGDGTINEVVNGLGPDAPPLAVIPLGTANVLALELGFDANPVRLARAIAEAEAHPIRVGRVNGRRFVMMVGVGFDAHVVAAVDPVLKRRLGKGAYVLTSLAGFFSFPFRVYSVDIDGVRHRAASVIVAKGHYYAGPFVCAPDARLASPRLYVCLFASKGPLAAMRYAIWLLLGRLSKLKDVAIVPAAEVRIDSNAGEPVQGDGDILAEGRVALDVEPRPVMALSPKASGFRSTSAAGTAFSPLPGEHIPWSL